MNDLKCAEISSRRDHLLVEEKVAYPEANEDLLEISGNSYSILKYKVNRLELQNIKYLKINVIGTQINSFGYGCLYFLIAMSILFFFPMFLFCTDCCRRRIQRMFNVDLNVYQHISAIIAELKPKEFYFVVQDNFFNETKCNTITRGLE